MGTDVVAIIVGHLDDPIDVVRVARVDRTWRDASLRVRHGARHFGEGGWVNILDAWARFDVQMTDDGPPYILHNDAQMGTCYIVGVGEGDPRRKRHLGLLRYSSKWVESHSVVVPGKSKPCRWLGRDQNFCCHVPRTLLVRAMLKLVDWPKMASILSWTYDELQERRAQAVREVLGCNYHTRVAHLRRRRRVIGESDPA